MKKLIILAVTTLVIYCFSSCSPDNTAPINTPNGVVSPSTERIPTPGGEPATYDPSRGAGKFTHVDIGEKLDGAMATNGEKTFGVKCIGCHKLTDEKLVGPGWKDVTVRHKPEWIMNFITNTDEMLNKDPKAQEQLAICLVRMPNQSLADDEARGILEFMRKNDGTK